MPQPPQLRVRLSRLALNINSWKRSTSETAGKEGDVLPAALVFAQ